MDEYSEKGKRTHYLVVYYTTHYTQRWGGREYTQSLLTYWGRRMQLYWHTSTRPGIIFSVPTTVYLINGAYGCTAEMPALLLVSVCVGG